jgi:hypothetical protein
VNHGRHGRHGKDEKSFNHGFHGWARIREDIGNHEGTKTQRRIWRSGRLRRIVVAVRKPHVLDFVSSCLRGDFSLCVLRSVCSVPRHSKTMQAVEIPGPCFEYRRFSACGAFHAIVLMNFGCGRAKRGRAGCSVVDVRGFPFGAVGGVNPVCALRLTVRSAYHATGPGIVPGGIAGCQRGGFTRVARVSIIGGWNHEA